MAPTAAKKDETKGKVEKAKSAAAKTLSQDRKKSRKVRTSVHFFRPKTLKLARNPKYARSSKPSAQKMDHYAVIKSPLATPSAMAKIENNNTLVFLVDPTADKRQIKTAVTELYKVSVERVNTLIRPDGKKKAYIKLKKESDALEVANKMGIV